jgi:hypothetical protein
LDHVVTAGVILGVDVLAKEPLFPPIRQAIAIAMQRGLLHSSLIWPRKGVGSGAREAGSHLTFDILIDRLSIVEM